MLPKGLSICHTVGVPDTGSILQDLDAFKRSGTLHLIFLESNDDSQREDTPPRNPIKHKSFKLKSSFNPAGPFQLEFLLSCIEHELQKKKKKKYKENINQRGILSSKFLEE